MTHSVLYVQATRPEVYSAIHNLPNIITGRDPQFTDHSTAIAARVGNAFLANVKLDYIRKSTGGIGEDGRRWPPLKYRTVVAKVRRHKGALKGNSIAAQAYRQRFEEFKRQAKALRSQLNKAFPKANSPEAKKARKQQIEQRIADQLGYFAHEEREEKGFEEFGPFSLTLILRDRGILFNSLSAGVESLKYNGPDSDKQIFEPRPGSVIVGTNVAYASTHQHGDMTKNIPPRPFFPEANQIPESWILDMREQAWMGAIDLLKMILA